MIFLAGKSNEEDGSGLLGDTMFRIQIVAPGSEPFDLQVLFLFENCSVALFILQIVSAGLTFYYAGLEDFYNSFCICFSNQILSKKIFLFLITSNIFFKIFVM